MSQPHKIGFSILVLLSLCFFFPENYINSSNTSLPNILKTFILLLLKPQFLMFSTSLFKKHCNHSLLAWKSQCAHVQSTDFQDYKQFTRSPCPFGLTFILDCTEGFSCCLVSYFRRIRI